MKPDRYDPIAAALKEDIGTGDITTEFFVPDSLHASGRIVAQEKAIVAGSGAAAEVFRKFSEVRYNVSMDTVNFSVPVK
jgi:nicotinate-nucleotide pyrophosphorylase